MSFLAPPADYLQGLSEPSWRGCEPELFQVVQQAYDSPGRVYHAWQHIEMCLREFKTLHFVEPRTVLVALLFHDAVYVAGDSQNEARSAALAWQSLQRYSNLTTSEQDRVVQLIMLTANHHHHDTVLDDDAAAFIDIDLAVLCSDWPTYQAYAQGVEREFCPSVVSPAMFRLGRRRFLQGLLSQPSIFLTPAMRERGEVVARRNLQREIEELLI
jgi:predicted metal-dependent HD superfamily phosphohydrolase